MSEANNNFYNDSRRESVMGLSVCTKCNLINKIRSADVLKTGKCQCSGCGAEIEITRKIKKA